MNKFSLALLLASSLVLMSACTDNVGLAGNGYPGATPDINLCNPGHDISRACPPR